GHVGTLTAEEPLLCTEIRRPLEALGVRKAEIGTKGVAHRLDEPSGVARRKAVLPPGAEHLHAVRLPVDPGLDPPDEAVAEENRQHVVTPATLLGLEEPLPDEVEIEQLLEERGVPEQRVERGDERDGGSRLGRLLEQRGLFRDDEPLASHALDLD